MPVNKKPVIDYWKIIMVTEDGKKIELDTSDLSDEAARRHWKILWQ